jgi:hypothetical protein
MTLRSSCWFVLLAVALPGFGLAADPDLPQPLDVTAAESSLVTNSPFTRALSLSESLALTGVAYVEGKPVVTLVNRTTKESYVVSDEANAQGWRLAETSASQELKRTQVKIMVGSEIVTVRYSDEQLAPPPRKPSSGGASNGGPPSQGNDPNRVRTSSYLGDGGRDRYYALSDGARDRFRDMVRQHREANPNASFDQVSAYAKKEFEKVEAEDKRARK